MPELAKRNDRSHRVEAGLTLGALAVRVEVRDDGRRGVFESQQTGPDEALALRQADDLHLRVLGHVGVERRLHVICAEWANRTRAHKTKNKRNF